MTRVAICDVFIATAAVGDFRPAEIAPNKLKKAGSSGLRLELVQNPDILAEVAALPRRPFLVGFAAETEQVEAFARAKLERKKLDLIAANEVGGGRGFEVDDNQLLLLWPGGSETLPRSGKHALAHALLERVVSLRAAARGGA